VIFLVKGVSVGRKLPSNTRLPITVRHCEDKEEYQKQWRNLNPNWWLKRYGLTQTDYNELLVKQNSSCAICFTKEPGGRHSKFQVDHNHTTNKVRGLLCGKCNRGLGFFNDNYTVLEKAANYIREHTST
jgi:hypothetical protein